MEQVFGRGFKNPTVTQYLVDHIFPDLSTALNELLVHVQTSGELERWRVSKEVEYAKAKREERA
jgi:hypothetical protein